jgi:DNA polymerase I
MKKKLVLLDGHSTLHKAYHGIKDSLTNSKGEATSTVYGFLNTFFRLKRELKFQHVVVVFDPPGGSFRKDVYAQYKANRPPAPPDLISQLVRVKEALALLGVPTMELPKMEADDVIGALTKLALENDGEVLVCSLDKDLFQLVQPGVKIWREHRGQTDLLDEEAVKGRLGVLPHLVPAYLGLVGDSSDNIPGVLGVGPKTAASLLNEYGSLEEVLKAAPSIKKKKLSENLQQFADRARLSMDLATLKLDCVTEFDWDSFCWEPQESEELRAFYREMNFQYFLREMGSQTVEERTVDYRTVENRAELEQVAGKIKAAGLASIDTETTGLDPFSADLVGISLSWKKNQAVYLSLGHHQGKSQLTVNDAREVLSPLFADDSVRWVAHHWNYDYKILLRAGFNPPSIHSDTLVAAYLLNPESGTSRRLKDLAVSELGIKMTEISELIGAGDVDDMLTMATVAEEDSSEYACQDADVTLQLHYHFFPSIQQANMEDLYLQVECPLTSVLARMELEGVRIDHKYFRLLSGEATIQLAIYEKAIFELAGRPFKVNSPKQVAEILFTDLGLPPQKKGKTGYSTDVTVLEALRSMHPLPAKLLEYRQTEKLKNTYLDPLPGLIQLETGRVHSSFNQTVTATGRLSSSNPNLQNIPVRTEQGRKIRAGFTPRQQGWVLLSADYSQIELRILAHLSGDDALCEAFSSGQDVHTLTASRIFAVPVEEVTSQMRGQAKTINFGIIYGMSDFRLSRDLEISRQQAKQFIEDYFAAYSGVKNFIEETKEKARKEGAVRTLLGRRRFVPGINNRNANERHFAERIAVNTPIQGTSADMIKLAMLKVVARMEKENLQSKMILQVHDELIFDTPHEEVEGLTKLVVEEMEGAMALSVPLRVDVGMGANWAECK